MKNAIAIEKTVGITIDILQALVNGVVVASKALDNPGIGFIIDEAYGEKFDKKRFHRVGTTIKRLEKQDYVTWKENNGEMTLVINGKGRRKVLAYDIKNLKLNKKNKWDGKFRVIIFDIPESKKAARENLRRKLKELDFYKLQKSVFISPFECKDEINYIKHSYGTSICELYTSSRNTRNRY